MELEGIQTLLFARAAIGVYLGMLVVTLLFLLLRARSKGESFLGFPMKLPRWAYPLVVLASLGFLTILFFSIVFVLEPEFHTRFLPLALLGSEVVRSTGAGLLIIGATITEGALLNLGSSTRLLLPESATNLRTGGFYSVSRNPIYLGLYISLFGIFLVVPNMFVLLSLVPFLVNNHFRIRMEEEYLEETFGEDYARYRKRVGRYFLKV